nr:gliding motility-associated C-terminal domain-containing protein [uncultured Carboxylicivirga sp.]
MNLSKVLTLLTLLSLFTISLHAQVTATIVSDDTAICENSGNLATIKIKFEGDKFPFGLIYITYDLDGNPLEKTYLTSQTKLIRSEDLDNDNVWTKELPFPQSTTLKLDKVFDADCPTTIVNGEPTYIEESGYPCNSETNITIDEMPDPDAGLYNPTCGYNVQLSAKLTDENHTMYWSDIIGGSFDNKNIPNAVFTSETKGIYTLTLTEENGACTETDTVTLELWGTPKATLSGNQTICSNDGNNYILTTTADISNGTAPYNYIISNGIEQRSFVGSEGTNAVNYPVTEEANWNIIELNDANECEAVDITGSATVIDNKPNANAGISDKWCESDLSKGYTLNATLDKGTGEWLNTTGITFNDNTLINAVATASDYGKYPLTWKETYEGCSETTTIDINFINPPTLELSETSTNICEGESTLLKVTTTGSYYPLTLTYSNETTKEELIQSSYQEITLQPSDIGEITYWITSLRDNEGCTAEWSNKSFVTNVTAIPVPNPGDYFPVCGNHITLDALLNENEVGTWSSLSGGTFSDIHSPITDFSIDKNTQLPNESHTLSWQVKSTKNNNCSSTETIELKFNKLPENIFAGDDQTLYLIDTISLHPTGWEPGMNAWWNSSSSQIILQTLINGDGKAANIPPGSSYLTWHVESSEDCYMEDQILLSQNPLTAPTGFSPNASSNNVFRIGGAEHLTNVTLNVFNKNGMLVYDSKNFGQYNNEAMIWWDGRDNNNKLLPADTYYYTFTGVSKENGELFTKKNFVVIKY